MKKIVLVLILLAVIAGGAWFYWKKSGGGRTRATELAPAETIFFAHFPDLKRTAERWPQTALAKIGREPEVQAFLEKPRDAVPLWKLWEERLAQLVKVQPREAFLAVTSIEGTAPRFVAGFAFSGRKAAVEKLLAEPRASFKQAWPAGKADVILHGKTPIETFTYAETMVGEAFRGGWYFIANDLDLLRRTLEAAPHGLGAQALAANELFQRATAKLPGDGEALLFAQTGALTERVISLLVATGQAPDPQQLEELKKMQAVAWGTKMDGAQMRDTLFVLKPGGAEQPALARSTLAFSNAQTFLTYAASLPAKIEIPESSLALGAMAPGFAAMQKGFADQGLNLADLGKAFGPEFGAVVNWAENAGQPSVLLAVDVRDAALARRFVEAATSGAPAWGRTAQDGAMIFQSPAVAGLMAITPTAALTERFLVVGFSPVEVSAGLAQLETGQAVIAATPAYAEAVKAVGAPTAGFAYLDLKTLFDRGYGMLRPFIAMSLAFSPDGGKYVDAGKLPSAAAISQHLTPSVYSQSVTEDGTLVESVGALTFNQVLVGVAGGAVAAAFPMIEKALSGGLKLDPSAFGLPAPATKSAATPVPSEKPPQTPANAPIPTTPAPAPRVPIAPVPPPLPR